MTKRLAALGALLLGIGVAANGCMVHPRVGADVTFGGGHHHRPPPRVYYVERHHDHYGGYHGGGHHGGGYHGGRHGGGPRGRHW